MLIALLMVALIVGGAAYFMHRGYRATAAYHRQFYEAALSGEPQRLRGLFSKDLDDRIEPVDLNTWINNLQLVLGPYEGTSAWGSRSNASTEDGVTTLDLRARSQFAHGEAQTALKVVDDRIHDFAVWSDQLPAWGPGPAAIEGLRAGARAILQRLLTLQIEDAFDLMDPTVRDDLPPEEATRLVDRLIADHGRLEDLHYHRAMVHERPEPVLTLIYELEMERSRLEGLVMFTFEDRRPLPVGFDVRAPK